VWKRNSFQLCQIQESQYCVEQSSNMNTNTSTHHPQSPFVPPPSDPFLGNWPATTTSPVKIGVETPISNQHQPSIQRPNDKQNLRDFSSLRSLAAKWAGCRIKARINQPPGNTLHNNFPSRTTTRKSRNHTSRFIAPSLNSFTAFALEKETTDLGSRAAHWASGEVQMP
jgi:hypothetical protein